MSIRGTKANDDVKKAHIGVLNAISWFGQIARKYANVTNKPPTYTKMANSPK